MPPEAVATIVALMRSVVGEYHERRYLRYLGELKGARLSGKGCIGCSYESETELTEQINIRLERELLDEIQVWRDKIRPRPPLVPQRAS